jgi:hypothetical protein
LATSRALQRAVEAIPGGWFAFPGLIFSSALSAVLPTPCRVGPTYYNFFATGTGMPGTFALTELRLMRLVKYRVFQSDTVASSTLELKELWAKVANERLEHTGDEARAIREANAVVARQAEPT